MELNEYQFLAKKTINRQMTFQENLTLCSLGLAGEAGECVDMIKKYLYHGHELNKEEVCKEIGDVLWYLSQLADTLGIAFNDVADKNIAKLKKRYPQGFSIEASINRKE